MKNRYIVTIASLLVILSSCARNALDASLNPGNTDVVLLEVFQPSDVRTTLGDSNVPLWRAGDKIWVSDGENAVCGVVDAQYDGKAAAKFTLSGLKAGVKYYVAYPFDENIRLEGDDIIIPVPASQDGSFASANIASGIVPAGLKSVSLENRTALLKLAFSEDVYSSVEIDSHGLSALSGTAVEPLDKVHSDFASAEDGAVYISCLPGELAEGTRITFVDKSGKMGGVTTSVKHTVEAGTIYYLGEISGIAGFDSEAATDLSKAGTETANCYIIPGSGSYRFKATQGCSNEGFESAAYAQLIWETVNTSTAPERYSLVQENSFDNGYVYFRIPEGDPEGNALLSIRDGNGKILWSWHLWLVNGGVGDQTIQNEGGSLSGAVMLARNLGSIGDNPLKSTGFGMVYQYGRKDPFVTTYRTSSGSPYPYCEVAGVQITTSPMTDETGDLKYLTAHPTVKITGSPDWLTDTSDGLWDSADKSVTDPCPYGYHIPYKSALQGLPAADTWYDGTSPYAVYRGYKAVVGSYTLRFPVAGRQNYADGKIGNFTIGYYWYSTTSGSENSFKFAESSPMTTTALNRADLAFVRCQKNSTNTTQNISFTYSSTAGGVFWSPWISLTAGYPESYIKWNSDSEKVAVTVGTSSSHTYENTGENRVTFFTPDAKEVTIYSMSGISDIDLSGFRPSK